MSRLMKHDTPSSGSHGKEKVCGGIVRRLYERDDSGGKTKYTITSMLFCRRCGQILQD